jgi:hypothetical protein
MKLKKLEKQNKPKIHKRKEIKIREEINETETKNMYKRQNKLIFQKHKHNQDIFS